MGMGMSRGREKEFKKIEKKIEKKMEIKKCCGDYKFIRICNVADDGKIEDMQPSIWYIPKGEYEECGMNIKILYCPFCGKKIEVI